MKPARYRTISEKLWVPNETRQTWVDDHERKGKDGKSIHVKGHWRTVPGEGGHWETVTKQILVEEEIVEAVEKLKPAAPPPVSKPLNDEGVVANQLKMARILKNNGNTAAAIKRLEEIVRKSPDTEAAREANELLTKLK